MTSRRDFLATITAGLGATVVAPVRAAFAQDDIKTALNGTVGLQLWSLRADLPKDLAGTLAKVRALGFREVEGAGLWKHTAAELRAALDTAGLRCQSAHMTFERLHDNAAAAFAEVKALGAEWVVCPWIPHDGDAFTHDDVMKAADTFNRVATSAREAGLRFAYHCHGYEFVPSPEGTLFDTLAGATDPARVTFQIDVFHALFGGADPAALIDRYKTRVTSLHLKDLKKGVPIKAGTAIGPPEADVPVGTGQVDMPATLRAAMKAGTALYYIEDESADPWGHIPTSVAYLKGFKNAA
jgi:sugar phosphate isomerase/epimerase